MKNLRWMYKAICIGMIAGAFSMLSTPAIADGTELAADEAFTGTGAVFVGRLNLRTGLAQVKMPTLSVTQSPIDSDGDGFYEAVVRVNLHPASGFTRLCALLDYEGTPAGYTLNIGDSVTNNGFGGDAATQSRDAEMQIVDDVLSVFSSDIGGGTRIARHLTALTDGGLKVCVANMFLGFGNPLAEHDFTAATPGAALLYALNGQPDTEGPVNFDIYLGFNRVVSGAPGNGRIGSGLSKVNLTLE